MSDLESASSDIDQAWDIGCSALQHKKSKIRFENTYKKWFKEKKESMLVKKSRIFCSKKREIGSTL